METLKDKPFALIGVNVGGGAGKLTSVMQKERLPWRSFADSGSAAHGAIAKAWNLSATPTFYLLDAKGVIRHKWPGGAEEKVINEALEKLLKETAGPK